MSYILVTNVILDEVIRSEKEKRTKRNLVRIHIDKGQVKQLTLGTAANNSETWMLTATWRPVIRGLLRPISGERINLTEMGSKYSRG